MVLLQIVIPVVCTKVVVFRRFSTLPNVCSCIALLRGAFVASLLLWVRGGRTVGHALGIVFLSGTGSLQCVPAVVVYPDSGPVWHGQSSVCVSRSHVPRQWSCLAWVQSPVCASRSHVPRQWSCLAWAVFSVCQP